MLSVGTDIIELERMAKSLRKDGFLLRFFGEQERAELQTRKNNIESIAASFAAKEAFAKALGTGVRGFSLREVQLLHNELGAPLLSLSGNAERIAQQRGLHFSVSLSHTETLACAVVIAFSE